MMTHQRRHNSSSNLVGLFFSLLCAPLLLSIASSSSSLVRANPSASAAASGKPALVLASVDYEQPLDAEMEKRWGPQQRFAFAKRRPFAFAKRGSAYLNGDFGSGTGRAFAFAKRSPLDAEEFAFADKRFAFADGPRRFAFAKRAADPYWQSAYRNFAFAR